MGGTTPASGSLEIEIGVPDCACVESKGISKKTLECVPGVFKGLCSILKSGWGRLCPDSP